MKYNILPWRDIYSLLAAWFHFRKRIIFTSLAYLLQSRGFKVRIRKLDPYLNIDPGTMSPFQHGEAFVTDDGAETDLDLGHYERSWNFSEKSDNITTGKIYNDVLRRERQGKYLENRTGYSTHNK